MTNATGFNIDGTIYRIDYNTLVNKPEAYTLPTASTTVLGGVKVDGSTITITDGVISGVGSYTLPTASTTVLGGVKIDGSTITITNGVISAILQGANKDLSNLSSAGNTKFISSSSYVAGDTTITVGSSGCDFTTLQDAIDSLSNKFSDGTITILMSGETFTVTPPSGTSSCISIDTSKFNFVKLVIQGTVQSGSSTPATIITSSEIPANGSMLEVIGSGTSLEINNIYFNCTGSSNTAKGINVISTKCDVEDCKFNNFSIAGVSVKEGSSSRIGSNEFSSCGIGLLCDGSNLTCSSGSTLTMDTITTGVSITNGGIVKLLVVTKAFTSVTTEISTTIGTATADGLALGSWS